MKDKILFVTKGGDKCDEGFSYVLELAKTLDAGIEALIMKPLHLSEDFEDIMAASAFAETGDFKTAKEILEQKQRSCINSLEEKVRKFTAESEEAPVDLICHISGGNVETAINQLLKNIKNIDMVLLSPSLSESNSSFDIRKLLKNISKPIVNISKLATARI